MTAGNKEIYTTKEFENWAFRGGLIRSEAKLFEDFLSPEACTLEAGTSGGRILLELQRKGFEHLWGFDYVPEFIEEARRRDVSGKIHYDVMDATSVSYFDNQFDQIIYLQQIVSIIESKEGRERVIREACRILKPGGIALFSFLCIDIRQRSFLYRTIMKWWRVLRLLRRQELSIQYQSWLMHARKPNWSALIDRPPYVYWYRAAEAESGLKEAGFEIIGVGTDEQVRTDTMQKDTQMVLEQPLKNHLYFACRKPVV